MFKIFMDYDDNEKDEPLQPVHSYSMSLKENQKEVQIFNSKK